MNNFNKTLIIQYTDIYTKFVCSIAYMFCTVQIEYLIQNAQTQRIIAPE